MLLFKLQEDKEKQERRNSWFNQKTKKRVYFEYVRVDEEDEALIKELNNDGFYPGYPEHPGRKEPEAKDPVSKSKKIKVSKDAEQGSSGSY